MKKSVFYAIAGLICFASCSKEIELIQPTSEPLTAEDLKAHAESLFGITFAPNQDWCTTTSGKVTITLDNDELSDVVKVQILTVSPFGNRDANGSVALNEAALTNGQSVTLYYDAPQMYKRLYAACVTKSGTYFIKGFNVGTEKVVFTSNEETAETRANADNFDLVKLVEKLQTPVIDSIFTSFEHERCVRKTTGWANSGWENELLYATKDREVTHLTVKDYTEDYKEDLYDMIFNQYLQNKASNIEIVRNSDYFVKNNNYPLVTKGKPVIMAPIYRNDGTSLEIEDCELYYYYFKQSDIQNMSEEQEIQFLKDLPKYRAVHLYDVLHDSKFPLTNDTIFRRNAYALVYWGDTTPQEGEQRTGSYTFPSDYKLGFMIRAIDKDNNKKKSGEMYCDGRLNKQINKWGHYATGHYADDDPRMAWFWANNRSYLCCETGSDRDLNDIVFEVLGGLVVPPPPTVDKNKYTFCFEDTPKGDYDLNDVVIRGSRIDETHVQWELVACGAHDELYIKNINGAIINDNAEIHQLFGKTTTKTFVNTEAPEPETPFVIDIVEVDKEFSFLNAETQPYLYDKTTDVTVPVALAGQDPHAIMVPYNFHYALEKIRINRAYSKFNSWAAGAYMTDGEETGKEWYLNYNNGLVSNALSE